MLQPSNRLTLLDALAPPAGFRLESAMAVTFTLDLRALLAAPAALAFAGPEGIVADGTGQEPIELLHALRSHAGSLTVFCQAGEIALAPSQRVFAFLERAVIPAVAPRGGVVHPKVWVLRYGTAGTPEGPPTEQRLRVLVASRNLTFDPSWDSLVRLDEASDGSGASLAPVADLFEGLLDCVVGDVPTDHRERVRSLAAALRAARFVLPAGVDEIRAHVLGLSDATPPLPLPAASERSLVISPFVSDGFFRSVHPTPVDELVSTPEWLDRLDEATLKTVGAVHVFDDGSLTDVEAEGSRSPHDPGRPLAGLHAKVFAFESGSRARLFLGSANATGAAFGGNVEILLELVGALDVLGIDQFCQGNGDERGLRDLFVPYRRREEDAADERPGSLDAARRAIAELRFTGLVEESDGGWAVTYRTAEPLAVPDGTVIFGWPLASAGNRRQIAAGEPLEARFETTLEAMSGFLAFELTHPERHSTGFVVPVPLAGVPEERERQLLAALVGNAERFFRYLLALLDDDTGELSLLEAVEGLSSDGAGDAGPGGPINAPVLEKLLRTMRRDPTKLAELHPLVSDLAADGALPDGFAELWWDMHDVALESAEAS